ncbi:pentatricopeptide repeat-containing protein At3g02490, mitochondrial-like [Aristolochia californica]|uniref:pentatricopeptide repeat-containing protein At3g02490, mitochondrial-like n=1 Tax=Aristolochia californica TaxID=171875 RepID=UPI0035D6BC5B
MDLFSRVIQIFTTDGNHLTKQNFDSVLKSLTSAGKLGESNKILEAMEEGCFLPDSTVYGQVVSGLYKTGKFDEAAQFLDNFEKPGESTDLKPWVSLIDGLCAASEIDKAIHWFDTLVDKRRVEIGGSALFFLKCGSAFEILINGFCRLHGPQDAYNLLVKMVKEKQLKPWHSIYKIMIDRLLNEGKLKDAKGLIGLMRTNGFPPFVDPFIGNILKHGKGKDAINFLKAMTIKRCSSMSVFLRVFKGLLDEGRHNVAHDLLSISPGYIRSHVDVLDLFASLRSPWFFPEIGEWLIYFLEEIMEFVQTYSWILTVLCVASVCSIRYLISVSHTLKIDVSVSSERWQLVSIFMNELV